jgi:hypothetical protein
MKQTLKLKIARAKSQLLLAHGGQLSLLQYHQVTDTISAFGKNISSPQNAVGNIDKHGYGRYVVAAMNFQGEFETIHGEALYPTALGNLIMTKKFQSPANSTGETLIYWSPGKTQSAIELSADALADDLDKIAEMLGCDASEVNCCRPNEKDAYSVALKTDFFQNPRRG